jgi:mannose-6-phosphate isomerase-like protein (cupin superfamily)|tara:strand:- start:6676 stop:7050 length:375 start_codon:yes stop_codon:yes gene_type:complete
MIKFYSNYFKKEDPRGKIVGLINQGNWEELNYFCTDSDQIRGNHYHKKTDELFIILKGKLEIQLTEVSQNGELEGRTESFFIKKGDVFVIPKMIYHVFKIIEKSEWINALSIKMDNKFPDINSL